MHKSLILLILLTLTSVVYAKPHIPDSVMHKDGLYVDNLKIYNDSAIFQGINLKLDLFNSIYYLAKTKAQMQTYEIALNVRLKQRFYPTIELGYMQGQMDVSATSYIGKGGWTGIGLDFNGLRKNLNQLDAFLVGIRVGTAVQQYDLLNVPIEDRYWQTNPSTNFTNQFRADCWGEVVAGCHVHIYSGLMMGWYLRLKVLFTRKEDGVSPYPYFIPGFGYRDMTQWGLNYYIGWKF